MAGVNKVILIGNLGQDPEVTNTNSGKQVAKFSIATSETFTKNGEKVIQTEWHRIELWEALAKVAGSYLKKGDTVYIEGKLKTESWEDKEGNKKQVTKVIGTGLTLLGGKKDGNSEAKGEYIKPTAEESKEIDDMPF